MPFPFLRRKRRVDAEPMEMEAVQEDEDADHLEPGQPVPYEASSWSPPSREAIYRPGPADLDSPRERVDARGGPLRRPERVHVVEVPPGAEGTGVVHECLQCGFTMKVPRRRPVEVQCPDCGAKDVLR